jgi:AraC-like DNA-binding protein
MTVEISPTYNQPLSKSNTIPEELKVFLIPGTEGSYRYSCSTDLLLQQFTVQSFHIAYLVFQVKIDECFNVISQTEMAALCVSLKGEVGCNMSNQTVNISEGSFAIFFNEMSSFNLAFNKEGKHIVLIIFLSKESLLQQLIYFPALENFKQSVIENKKPVDFLNNEHVSIKMFDCIHQLIHSPYSEVTERFHTGIVKNLFNLSLKEATAHSNENAKFSLEDLERLYAAKNYIDTHLLQHDTISQLSRKVGINELKLKKGFKEIFGIGVYGYRKRERLRIAKNELEQTRKSIKQVAKNAGYRNANNFSAAFKKVFGVSPQLLRKKYNPDDSR